MSGRRPTASTQPFWNPPFSAYRPQPPLSYIDSVYFRMVYWNVITDEYVLRIGNKRVPLTVLLVGCNVETLQTLAGQAILLGDRAAPWKSAVCFARSLLHRVTTPTSVRYVLFVKFATFYSRTVFQDKVYKGMVIVPNMKDTRCPNETKNMARLAAVNL